MAIKYKTNLKKIKISELKQKIYDLLSECDMPGNDGTAKFYVYHGVRVTKYTEEYSVKIYHESSTGGQKLIEINNLYLLHLIAESIPNEIEITT